MDPTLSARIVRLARTPGGALSALQLAHRLAVSAEVHGLLTHQEAMRLIDDVIAATRKGGGDAQA